MILGIDPGKKGGLAFIDGEEDHCYVMPLCGKEIDGAEIARLVKWHKPDSAVIEKVHAMPKQGVSSTFNFGMGYGILMGVLEAIGTPYRLVTPQAWKKKILSGTAKDKSAAVNHVRRSYPHIDLTPGKKRTAHDGIADAVCLAEYGKG